MTLRSSPRALVRYGVIALAQPFLALTMVLSGALRGAGDTRGPLLVTFIGIWLVRLPLGFFLVGMTSLGLIGAWITMIVDQASARCSSFAVSAPGHGKG